MHCALYYSSFIYYTEMMEWILASDCEGVAFAWITIVVCSRQNLRVIDICQVDLTLVTECVILLFGNIEFAENAYH